MMRLFIDSIINTVKTVVDTIVNTIKNVVYNVTSTVSNLVETYFPGGSISLTIFSLNAAAVITSSGILFIAVVSGLLACISIAALWVGATPKIKEVILKVGKHGSWWMDLALTLTLTILGFSLGPTMGLLGVMLGLNMTAMFAILRWMANRTPKSNNTHGLAVASI
jgi:hypothetical protein